jgi:lipoic acid synthetase
VKRAGAGAGAAAGASGGPAAGSSAGPGRKPPWLKKRLPDSTALRQMEVLLRERGLHTVCESALCPNLGECFARGTATFLIMGDVCTRDCGFCGVAGGRPTELDPDEPRKVADMVARLGLRHAVVTSVTRDDLEDGGAGHYVATIKAIREQAPGVTLEVLVPDFAGRMEALDLVLAEAPEVFNHNVETVSRLYPAVRPQAVFERSLEVIRRAASARRSLVKTGWMVGLGETPEEVGDLLRQVATAGVEMVTIGQYLRPSARHLPVAEYVPPEAFATYRGWGEALGLQVYAAPFVRSSFRAGESFARARSLGAKEKR